jgi:hypothetical protein
MPAEPANDSFVVSSKPGRSSWLLAAAGVAVAGLLLFVAIPSGELEPRQSSASKAAAVAAPPSMSAAPERPRTQGAGEGASANRPETPLPTTDARGPAARNGPADELAAADRAAAGGTEDEFIAEAPTPIDDIDDIDVIDEAAEEMPAAGDDQPKPVAADEETAATRVTSRSAAPHPSSSRHRSKRSRSRRSAARSKPPERETKAPEKPAVRGPSDKSADELLADATAALRANNNSTALQLASMSNRKHRSYSALQVMARAACRLKRTATANSAFARLPLARRSGIRSECRGHGVRLGV